MDDKTLERLAVKGGRVIGGAWLAVLILASAACIVAPPEWSARAGQFGDVFGSVNALFSALTLIMIVVAFARERQRSHDDRRDFETTMKAHRDFIATQVVQSKIAALTGGIKAELTSIEYLLQIGQLTELVGRNEEFRAEIEAQTMRLKAFSELLDAELQRLYADVQTDKAD